jgi:hypothetical protein
MFKIKLHWQRFEYRFVSHRQLKEWAQHLLSSARYRDKPIRRLAHVVFLDAFAKWRKATVSFVMSVPVRPSVRPHGTTRLRLDGFAWHSILRSDIPVVYIRTTVDQWSKNSSQKHNCICIYNNLSTTYFGHFLTGHHQVGVQCKRNYTTIIIIRGGGDLVDIWYLSIFRKSIEKIHVSLKWNEKNVYFTWQINIFYHILLNSS